MEMKARKWKKMRMVKFLPYGERYFKSYCSFSYYSKKLLPYNMSRYIKYVCSGYDCSALSKYYNYQYSGWGHL